MGFRVSAHSLHEVTGNGVCVGGGQGGYGSPTPSSVCCPDPTLPCVLPTPYPTLCAAYTPPYPVCLQVKMDVMTQHLELAVSCLGSQGYDDGQGGVELRTLTDSRELAEALIDFCCWCVMACLPVSTCPPACACLPAPSCPPACACLPMCTCLCRTVWTWHSVPAWHSVPDRLDLAQCAGPSGPGTVAGAGLRWSWVMRVLSK